MSKPMQTWIDCGLSAFEVLACYVCFFQECVLREKAPGAVDDAARIFA